MIFMMDQVERQFNKYRRVIIIGILALGMILRILPIWNPSEGGIRLSYREGDVASIARNFHEEGMNILHPRIDWRGEGPGYVESEFPILPWLMAASYKVAGIQEKAGRLIALVFSILTLFYFYALSRRIDNGAVLIVSLGVVALSPMLVELSSALQSEAMMLFFYLGSIYYFSVWMEESSARYLYLSSAMLAVAILLKATAAHVGLLFSIMLIRHYGIKKVLSNGKMWIYAGISLLPPLLWYTHAKNLYYEYGNSLGISNETHLVGWDFFYHPYYIKGILKTEVFQVWTPFGLAIAITGLYLLKAHRKEPFTVLWYLSIFVFYVLAAKTTADPWAYYYHAFAIFPAAIIIGMGVKAIISNAQAISKNRHCLTYGFIMTITILVLSILTKNKLWSAAAVAYALLLMVMGWARKRIIQTSPFSAYLQNSGRLFTMLTAALLIICGADIRNSLAHFTNKSWVMPYRCSQTFKLIIPAGESVLASGGPCNDDFGYPVAYNASYYFYWLDRKGMNVCVEDQRLHEIGKAAAAGMRYYVAEKEMMIRNPGFEADMITNYDKLAECEAAYLFRLQ